MELKLKKDLPINEDLELKADLEKYGKKQQLYYENGGWENIPEHLILRLFNKNKEFIIPFTLYNTRIANIWLKMFESLDPSDIRRKSLNWSWAKGYEKLIENNLLKNINNSIKNLNKKGYNFSLLEKCSLKYTNDLHHAFEKWGEEKDKEICIDQELADYFFTLNTCIHAIEYYEARHILSTFTDSFNKKNKNQITRFPGFLLLCSWLPKINIDLIDEDWNETINFPGMGFGQLNLGYNTLGKDLRGGILSQDQELFERKMVKPQKIFSNEITVRLDNIQSIGALLRYRKLWKKINPIDYKYGEFFKNREGRLSIGRVSNHFLYEHCNGLGLNIDLTQYTDFEFFLDA